MDYVGIAQVASGIPEGAAIFDTGAMTLLKRKKVGFTTYLVESLKRLFGIGSGALQTKGEGEVEEITELTSGEPHNLKYNAMLCPGAPLDIISAGALYDQNYGSVHNLDAEIRFMRSPYLVISCA